MRRGLFILVTTNIASKVVGVLREICFATFYGVSAVMGAFRFSQTITMVFMNFFTTDTLNAGFLPLFERYKQESPEQALCFFWFLFALLGLLSLLIFSLLFFGTHLLVHWFAPGFSGSVVATTEQFIRIFAFGVPFCLLGTLFSYLAMGNGAFFGVSARPMFESVGLMMGVVTSVWDHRVTDIAWGFVIVYILFFFMMVNICFRKKLLRWVGMTVLIKNFSVMRHDFWKTVRPLLILPLFMQGKYVVEKLFASLMAVSVVAALDYARIIIQTGVNVLAMPIGLLGLTVFSVIDGKQLAKKLESVVTILLGMTVPMTLFLVFNSRLVILTLYGYGKFDNHAVGEANSILVGMALAFFAQVVSYVLLKAMNAQLQNQRVMLYLILGISCNILFIILFYRQLGPLSLGIGESIYAMVIFILGMKYFGLFQLLLQLMLFLVPAAIFYSLGSIYLADFLQGLRWLALIGQLSWFAIFWGIALLAQKNMRTHLLGWVWEK